METQKWRSKLFQLILLSHLSSTISSTLPSHGSDQDPTLERSNPSHAVQTPQSNGCYWTESCQSKWIGGCGTGHAIISQSDDCNGLCPEPNYPSCFPFYTRFHCCIPESPKVKDRCTKCKNKVDYGDEYICCTDCSNPHIVDKNTRLGYCKTGAELAVQPKPRGKYSNGLPCSSPCGGGVRYRDVECFAVIKDASILQYPVDDDKCSTEKMPTRQESCNLRSCVELGNGGSLESRKHSRMPAWIVTVFILLGVVAVGSIGFRRLHFLQKNLNSKWLCIHHVGRIFMRTLILSLRLISIFTWVVV